MIPLIVYFLKTSDQSPKILALILSWLSGGGAGGDSEIQLYSFKMVTI